MSQCRLQTETKQDLVNHSGTPPSVMRSEEPKKRSGVEQEKAIRVTESRRNSSENAHI
jgi:hypothetical protein